MKRLQQRTGGTHKFRLHSVANSMSMLVSPSPIDRRPDTHVSATTTSSWIFKSENKVLCSSFQLFIPAIMDATLRKKKSRKGKSEEEYFSKARSAGSIAPSSVHKTDSKKGE